MAQHELKLWPAPFDAVDRNEKRFEYRRDDRGFEVGDVLLLRCWDPAASVYTGRTLKRRVTYIARGPMFDIPLGYCIMSIEPEEEWLILMRNDSRSGGSKEQMEK